MNSRDDDDFIIIGEALEPLDEDNLPKRKRISVEEQYALDAQGRRRFHGAFTGGFSAGYFNSVDTRDGWRPHHFKSSRHNKAEGICQRPEDFMDDEDTGEFGIAPTGIRASSNFVNYTGKGNKRERTQIDSNGPIPGMPVLRELLKTVNDTVGVKLLKKMGWKPGQGVGPRLTKKEKKNIIKRNEKVYGCSLPGKTIAAPEGYLGSSNDDDDDDDEVDEGVLFAPDDLDTFRLNPKDNYFGIGYSGLNKQLDHVNLIDASLFQMQDKNKKLSIRGQAFGVGAFEADDDDIYERDDMSRYDLTLGPETKKNKTRFTDKISESSDYNHVEGFVRAENQLTRKKLYRPPEIPENFKPIHVIKKSRFSAAIEEVDVLNESNGKSQAKHLNAQDRGRALDEVNSSQQLDISQQQVEKCDPVEVIKKPISIPSWMDKLTTRNFVRGSEKLKLTHSSDKYHVDSLKSNEGAKLEHTDYLSMENSKGDHEVEKLVQVEKSMEQSDILKNAENLNIVQNSDIKDFAMSSGKVKMFGKLSRTTAVWQPVSTVYKRFNICEPKNGCAQPNVEKKKKYSLFESLDFCSETENSEMEIQKDTGAIGIDGGSTKFNNLSDCKISNVEKVEKDHLDTSSTDIISEDSSKCSESRLKTILANESRSEQDAKNKKITDVTDVEEMNEEPSNSLLTSVENNVNIKEKYDLFKTIFLSSSESESDHESSEDINSDTVKSLLLERSTIDLNTKRNTSPARGIFAQLNLDDMLTVGGSSLEKHNESTSEDTKKIGVIDSLQFSHRGSNDMEIVDQDSNIHRTVQSKIEIPSHVYGPALPVKLVNNDSQSHTEKLFFEKTTQQFSGSNIKSTWVEKHKVKKSKKTKKKSKQKEKHRDKKHKHKSKKKKN